MQQYLIDLTNKRIVVDGVASYFPSLPRETLSLIDKLTGDTTMASQFTY